MAEVPEHRNKKAECALRGNKIRIYMGANLSYFYFCVVSLADWYHAIITILLEVKIDFINQTKQNRNGVTSYLGAWIRKKNKKKKKLFFIVMGKCVYSWQWPKRYPRVKETNSRYKALCKACRKYIDVAQMSEIALRSHGNGEGA